MVSNPKKCLLPAAGLMFISLVFDITALVLVDWLVMPCTDHYEVRLGLWTICLDPDDGCVSLTEQWWDLPGWLRGAVGMEVTGGVASLLTLLLTLACLKVPDRMVEESAFGLAMAALTSAAFIVVGQILILGGRSKVHEVFVIQEDFAHITCSKTPHKAHTSTAADLAWVAFSTQVFAGLLVLVAGMVTSKKSPEKLMNRRKTTSRQTEQTKERHAYDSGAFHYDGDADEPRSPNSKRRYPIHVKMMDAYHVTPSE